MKTTKASLLILLLQLSQSCIQYADVPKSPETTPKRAPGSDNTTTAQVIEEASIGIKNFDEINATYAKLTGITKLTTANSDFLRVYPILPTGNSLADYSFTHQVGITTLASHYCDALMLSQERASFVWSTFDPTLNIAFNFNTPAKLNTFNEDMIKKFWVGEELSEQQQAITEYNELGTELLVGMTTAAHARMVAVGLCTAALASAQVFIK